MSASLVGSEMCIRDRFKSARRPRRDSRGPSRPVGEGGRPPQRLTGATSEPVSYTHLTLPTICSV
eukprot:9810183-Alexandrium_andersonii.AAC.1